MKDINISELLMDKPQGTRLYSPMFGECFLDHIVKSNEEIWVRMNSSIHVFDKHGKHYSNGECMLFPSKEMRDWEKFSKPKFKDGDIVWFYGGNGCFDTIAIVKEQGKTFNTYASLETPIMKLYFQNNKFYPYTRKVRLASDSEKQQLFHALVKEGKAWDTEKKTIIDLPKKHIFKPFDRVLVRYRPHGTWKASFYSYYIEGSLYPFKCIGGNYRYCIPYEGNEHLLGTTDCPEEGGEK